MVYLPGVMVVPGVNLGILEKIYKGPQILAWRFLGGSSGEVYLLG